MERHCIARDQNDERVYQLGRESEDRDDFDDAGNEVEPDKHSEGKEPGQPAKWIEVLMDVVTVEGATVMVGGFPIGGGRSASFRHAGTAQRPRRPGWPAR